MSGSSPAPALPTSAIASACVDKDSAKIDGLNAGVMPIWEPGLEALVKSNAERGRLTFTTDLAEAVKDAEAVFIAVGTPARRGDGHADLTFVFEAVRELARSSSRARSSSPSRLFRSAPATRSSRSCAKKGLTDVSVASNPEFLREGAAIADFKHPDRIVVGAEDGRAQDVLREIYRPLVPQSRADPDHGPAHRRTYQICGQRLSRGQDQLHQRDRRSVRGGGR